MGLRSEEKVKEEWEHMSRLNRVEEESVRESDGKWLMREPGIDTLERLVRDYVADRCLGRSGNESWSDLAQRACGDIADARHVYLQGLMHGRLLALAWVLGHEDDLYPSV